MSVVVIGEGGLAGRACRQLTSEGHTVNHLRDAGDRELEVALGQQVDAVAVLLHDDTSAIRYVLAVAHIRPGVRIYVALFDRTAADQLRAVVADVTIISPADAALPTLLGAVMGPDVLAVGPALPGTQGARSAVRRANGFLQVGGFNVPESMRRAGLIGRLQGQLRPHDGNSAILLTGLLGMAAIIVVDTFLLMAFKGRGWLDAAAEAVAVLSTVGPAPDGHGYPWYQVFTIVAMLSAIIFLAVFTAGMVEHLLSGRYVGLFGRRAMPRSGHVIVVGLGQVGFRLCQELSEQGLAVIGLERRAECPNLPLARAINIPVLIGDGGMRRVMQKLRVDRSLAVVAVASDELDNIAVSITARALAKGVPVIIRAGNHDAIEETASLFSIGSVVDVEGLTVSAVSDWYAGDHPAYLADVGSDIAVISWDGALLTRTKTVGSQCPHVDRSQKHH
ncbi:MAG: NAD-binding protein [Candidatus Nanopelagicales bacterium]|nr:NAD-binding protein [Candidatus Nanopelagicales bacterium]